MQRVRLAIIGAGPLVEWGVLPVLTGPDAAAPQDTGAWWSRRPAVGGEIRYQPPALPEVTALCDPLPGGAQRAEGLTRLARVPAFYTDWRRMLTEIPVDAVLLAGGDEASGMSGWPSAVEVVVAMAKNGARWLWVDGPLAATLENQHSLRRQAVGNGVGIWPARPLRHSAAHRTARRLIERDSIGVPTAIQMRWPLPLDEPHAHAAFAALDLLLSFLGPARGKPARIAVSRGEEDIASSWITTTAGVSATILWAGADLWNSPLPRIEICGTQGRSIVCEASRRVQLLVPREATRTWEPPGSQPHVSAPNTAGVGEDLKSFLSAVAESTPSSRLAEEEADFEASSRALALWTTLWRAVESGQILDVEVAPQRIEAAPNGTQTTSPASTLTLNLG